jgi:hypothetical protein
MIKNPRIIFTLFHDLRRFEEAGDVEKCRFHGVFLHLVCIVRYNKLSGLVTLRCCSDRLVETEILETLCAWILTIYKRPIFTLFYNLRINLPECKIPDNALWINFHARCVSIVA